MKKNTKQSSDNSAFLCIRLFFINLYNILFFRDSNGYKKSSAISAEL